MNPIDTAMIVITIGAIVIGLISILIGHFVAVYGWLRAWWREGIAKATENVMSSEDEPEPEAEPVRADPDLADTYQDRTSHDEPPGLAGQAQCDIISRRMSRNVLIVLLAVQRRSDGDFLWSRNQIASFVGGTRAETLRLIGEARGDIAQPKRVFSDLNQSSRPAALDLYEEEHAK